jgi:hypothetical protein
LVFDAHERAFSFFKGDCRSRTRSRSRALLHAAIEVAIHSCLFTATTRADRGQIAEFGPLYDFSRIDPLKHKTTIIVQALNYGTLTHWRWLVQSYGREGVRDVLTHVPAFSSTHFRHSIRS